MGRGAELAPAGELLLFLVWVWGRNGGSAPLVFSSNLAAEALKLISISLSFPLFLFSSSHLEEARRSRERRVADGAQLAVDRVDADLLRKRIGKVLRKKEGIERRRRERESGGLRIKSYSCWRNPNGIDFR